MTEIYAKRNREQAIEIAIYYNNVADTEESSV